MVKYKEVSTAEKVIDKVFCDICKKEIVKDKFGYMRDYVHIEKEWGYNSNKDGVKTEVDICEECFDKICAK